MEPPDEPYLREREYRSDDPGDFAKIEEQVIEEGVRDNGELRNEQILREGLALRNGSPEFAHVSDLGAVAVNSYTRHEVFGPVNEALRTGLDLHKFVGQAKAITSGLSELPPYSGETVRFVNFGQNHLRTELAVAHYEPGKVTVEPSFTSTKKVTALDQKSLYPNASIEFRIKAADGRDVEGLSAKPEEREVVLKPGAQLLVTDKRLVTNAHGNPQWIIHAEEITAGHPKYLPSDAAVQAIHERRERIAADNAAAPSQILAVLEGPAAPSDKHRQSSRQAPVELTPEQRAQLEAMRKPREGWSSLNRVTDPPGVAALHSGTVETPQRQYRFISDVFKELLGINRDHYGDDPAFHRNGVEALLAYEERMSGDGKVVAAGRPEGHPLDNPATQREALRERLGGEWSEHNSLAGPIDSMRERPVGSRAVLSVEYVEPGPPPRTEHRVFAAVTTEHGVALLDPSKNRFAELPPDVRSVGLLAHHDGQGPVLPREEPAVRTPHKPSVLTRALEGELVPAAAPHPVGPPRSISGALVVEHQPETPAAPAAHGDIAHRLAGEDTPLAHHGYGAAGPEHWGAPPPDVPSAGDHDWSPLARATNPPSEPAIHAGTANANQNARYIAERHPELREVNPRFYDSNAFDRGYQTNCTRSVVAYAQRLLGIDAHAEPVLPRHLATKGTLEYVKEQLGGRWESHSDYDGVIRGMRELPIGSHGVIGVRYLDADGNVMGHVAMAVHTKEGVAFVDPQSGTLMHLPHPPLSVDLLPFGSLEHSDGKAAPHHQEPERPAAEGPRWEFPLEPPGVSAPEYDESTLEDADRALEILARVEEAAALPEEAPTRMPAEGPAAPRADFPHAEEEPRPVEPRMPTERPADPRVLVPGTTVTPVTPPAMPVVPVTAVIPEAPAAPEPPTAQQAPCADQTEQADQAERADSPRVDADGSWHWHGLTLSPDANRLADEFRSHLDEAANGGTDGTGGIRGRLRDLLPNIPGARLEDPAHELEPGEEIKRELAERLAADPGLDPRTALRRMSTDGTALRYPLSLPPEDYTSAVRELQSRLAEAGYEPEGVRNGWLDGSGGRQGIFAWWREPETGMIFEIEYHTPESWQAEAADDTGEQADDQPIPWGEPEALPDSLLDSWGEQVPVAAPAGVEEIADAGSVPGVPADPFVHNRHLAEPAGARHGRERTE